MSDRILIVEDNTDILDALADAITLFGLVPVKAIHGWEALEILAGEAKPSLIILDLMMPVMNGWEFRERQLRDPRIASIPVVLISANPNVEDEAGWLGASGSLKKPIELRDLKTLLLPYCKIFRR